MRQTLFVGVLALVSFYLPVSAEACECYCPQHWLNDPLEMKRHAKAVFVGEVLDKREATPEELRKLGNPFVVQVRVERYWKGVKTKEMLISAMGDSRNGCCDLSLKIGQKYLIYAVGRQLSTGCTRSRLLESAEEDLRALGPAQTPSQ